MKYYNIFEKVKKDNDKARKDLHPNFIITWGQAGAGKTELIKNVKNDFKNEEFVIIDADEYRKFHPNIKRFKENSLTAVIQTNEFVCELERELILYYMKKKYNVIFVTSSKDYKEITDLIDLLVFRNYKVCIYGIVTSFREGFISAQERYERQLQDENEFPRYVSFKFYIKSYKGTRDTLKKLIGDDRVSNIKLFKRTTEKIPVNLYNGNKLSDYDKVIKILKVQELITDNYEGRINELYDIKRARDAHKLEYKDLDKFLGEN